MNVSSQSTAQRGAIATTSEAVARAKAMEVLTRRRITESELFWLVSFSALTGALLGWLMFPEHFAVGGIAAIGWALAIVSLQQCTQLRREVNALITLAKLGGSSGG